MKIPDNKTQLNCDEEDFLYNYKVWDSAVAIHLAQLHNIALDEQRWTIIYALRNHYLSYGTVPLQRHICHINKMNNNCIDMVFDQHGIEAWRIAGLPDPGEEIKAYI